MDRDLSLGRSISTGSVQYYKNGTESKPSNEINSTLVSGIPVITKVSVKTTDVINGSIDLAWQIPDTINPPL